MGGKQKVPMVRLVIHIPREVHDFIRNNYGRPGDLIRTLLFDWFVKMKPIVKSTLEEEALLKALKETSETSVGAEI